MNFPPATTIIGKLGVGNGGPVHKYFTERCWVYMGSFTPGGPDGDLHNSVELSTDEIAYNSPYAHYLWQGILYVDPDTGSSWARKGVTKVATDRNLEYHTPGTGAYWDSRMFASKEDEIVKEVQQYIDRID